MNWLYVRCYWCLFCLFTIFSFDIFCASFPIRSVCLYKHVDDSFFSFKICSKCIHLRIQRLPLFDIIYTHLEPFKERMQRQTDEQDIIWMPCASRASRVCVCPNQRLNCNALWSGLLLFMLQTSQVLWDVDFFFWTFTFDFWAMSKWRCIKKCTRHFHLTSLNLNYRKRMKYLVCKMKDIFSFFSSMHSIDHVLYTTPAEESCKLIAMFFCSSHNIFKWCTFCSIVDAFRPSSRFFRLIQAMFADALIYIFQCLVLQRQRIYFHFIWWTKWKIGDGRYAVPNCTSTLRLYFLSHSRSLIALALRSNLTVSIWKSKCGPQPTRMRESVYTHIFYS